MKRIFIFMTMSALLCNIGAKSQMPVSSFDDLVALSQKAVADSVCTPNLENIFKALTLKIRYEAVHWLYSDKYGFFRVMTKEELSSYFELISECPIDIEELKVHEVSTYVYDTTLSEYDNALGIKHGRPVAIENRSEEEMDSYIEQLNCTPGQAYKEYMDFIRQIKSEKEIYLKCLDAELAKGDSSEYAKVDIIPYSFLPPGSSIMPIPHSITKLNFLKVFKEFIFNDDWEVLPEGLLVVVYLKCNCKITGGDIRQRDIFRM